jgi:flagellar basal body-associated protein FliL
MNEATIIAITGLLTFVGGWVINYMSTKQAARTSQRKDEVSLLREEVIRLHALNEELEDENKRNYNTAMELLEKNLRLRNLLKRHDIEIPEKLNGDSDIKMTKPR